MFDGNNEEQLNWESPDLRKNMSQKNFHEPLDQDHDVNRSKRKKNRQHRKWKFNQKVNQIKYHCLRSASHECSDDEKDSMEEFDFESQ